MGQLTCFVVFCHILSEASARLPMMSLSKLELRQLVGKTSRSATLSEIPHWHHLGQLPQLPPQSRCPLVPLCCLAQEHPTNNSGEKKKYLLLWAWFTSTESPVSNLLVFLLCGHPSRPGDLQQITAWGPKPLFLFFLKNYHFLPSSVVNEKPSDLAVFVVLQCGAAISRV